MMGGRWLEIWGVRENVSPAKSLKSNKHLVYTVQSGQKKQKNLTQEDAKLTTSSIKYCGHRGQQLGVQMGPLTKASCHVEM